jgi:hypothetical protein
MLALLFVASVVAGQRGQVSSKAELDAAMDDTRSVSSTAELHAAMDDISVNDIEMAAGVYHLADEPGLGCAPDPHGLFEAFLCIKRNLTIRAVVGATVVLDGGNTKGVVYVGTLIGRLAATLQGLHITNGRSQSGPGGQGGGGVYNDATLSITNCSVHDNFQGIAHVGNFLDDMLTVTDSEVYNNQGAGIINTMDTARATIIRSDIHHNTAHPYTDGGGIRNLGQLTLIDSRVRDNNSTAPQGQGGGIKNWGSLTLTNSEVFCNNASELGGGVCNDIGSSFSARNTSICFNRAHGQEDDCDLIIGHIGPCGGLNRCPAEPTNVCSPVAPLYVCNTDFLCQVAAPGQAGAESLAQCNACHPPPAQPAPL